MSETWSPPSRRRLWLLRHAEVDYFDPQGRPFAPASVPLTERGRAQADAVAAALAGRRSTSPSGSGLPRTRETAERVLAGREFELLDEPRFREVEMGRLADWAVGDAAAVRRVVLGGLSDPTPGSSFLGGETFGALAERVEEGLTGLLARPWRAALVVAHSVVNRTILARALSARSPRWRGSSRTHAAST